MSQLTNTVSRNVQLLYSPEVLAPDSLIRPKNDALAARLVRMLGGKMLRHDTDFNGAYGFPLDAVEHTEAVARGMTHRGDIYGGVVINSNHAHKSVLHPLLARPSTAPDWYTDILAREAEEGIFPGITVFDYDDVLEAYWRITHEYGEKVRVKIADQAGGYNQIVVNNIESLTNFIHQHLDSLSCGFVLEPQIDNPSVTSVSSLFFEGQEYAWIGSPWDKTHKGINRFGGNTLDLRVGGIEDLPNDDNAIRQRAIADTALVHSAYPLIDTVVSRVTYDVVEGETANGEFVHGVVDVSMRPSASSPAEIEGIEVLRACDSSGVRSHVEYFYGQDVRPQQHVFAENRYVKIIARVET